jgi:hypothetical protein
VDERCYGLDHDRVDVADSRLPPPVLTFVGGGRWRLEQAYDYRHGEHVVSVPAGFDFDLSSVPRLFWFLIAPFELSIAAPLLHDFLYRYGGRPPPGSVTPLRTYSRAEADRMFREIMQAEGVSVWRRVLAYAAVRLFGRSAWRS